MTNSDIRMPSKQEPIKNQQREDLGEDNTPDQHSSPISDASQPYLDPDRSRATFNSFVRDQMPARANAFNKNWTPADDYARRYGEGATYNYVKTGTFTPGGLPRLSIAFRQATGQVKSTMRGMLQNDIALVYTPIQDDGADQPLTPTPRPLNLRQMNSSQGSDQTPPRLAYTPLRPLPVYGQPAAYEQGPMHTPGARMGQHLQVQDGRESDEKQAQSWQPITFTQLPHNGLVPRRRTTRLTNDISQLYVDMVRNVAERWAQDVNNSRISNLNTWTIAEPLSTILRAGFCAL